MILDNENVASNSKESVKINNIRPTHLRDAEVMRLIVLGQTKAQVAAAMGFSIHNVERIVYSEVGQQTMREALQRIHTDIANTLPNMVESALKQLEVIMYTAKERKTQLDAIKVTLGLATKLTRLCGEGLIEENDNKKSEVINMTT